MTRLLCLLAGYLCGCFLTGEVVAHLRTGSSAQALGNGNPGMANIGEALGKKWGALVLLGDVLKTALACLLCRLLLFPELGQGAVLYAGLGAVLGHNFPFWKGFKGGKGVAVTCAFLVFFSPLWGVLCGLVGFAVVVATGYLPLGAVVIPALFVIPAFAVFGLEAGALAVCTALIMVTRHIHGLTRIAHGQEPRRLLKKTFEP